MQTNIKRKPLILATAIVLALVTIVGATFAWFTANDSVKNRLATKDALANVHIQETFVEPDDWKPGQTITKEVAVADVGSAPALVRVSFKEDLTVNQPPVGEATIFTDAMENATKKPLLFDNTAYAGPEWVEVTTTANATMGGIKLAADYSPVKVYAMYVAPSTPTPPGGSIGSYSFVMWAPIAGMTNTPANVGDGTGTELNGKLQAIKFDRVWNGDTKTLTLNNISYMTYPAPINQLADWSAAKPATADIGKSVAEGLINAMAAVSGKYPSNIQLNYNNATPGGVAATPTAGSWYYNANDGYFYYIGLVMPGTITPYMLKSLLLKGDADSDNYANMTFELEVVMKAIQHTKDAVDTEWSLSSNAALETAIHALCES